MKELVKRWYPGVDADRPRGQGSHRALDDIRESVKELAYYREHVFVAAESPNPAPSDAATSAEHPAAEPAAG